MITGRQVRAARALLAWDQATLAEKSGVSLPTVKRVEGSGDTPRGNVQTIEKIKQAVEAAGVLFIGDEDGGGRGVRLGVRKRTRR